MNPLPLPPRNFCDRILPVTKIAAEWYRFHPARYGSSTGALFFGRSAKFRFDAPLGEYGVMYIAKSINGAFIESFGRNPGRKVISEGKIRSRALTILESVKLTLVDLTGPGASLVGADGRLCTDQYSLTQAWSKAFHAHPVCADGILYCARHDLSCVCAAVFERAAAKFSVVAMHDFSNRLSMQLLTPSLRTYKIKITRIPGTSSMGRTGKSIKVTKRN